MRPDLLVCCAIWNYSIRLLVEPSAQRSFTPCSSAMGPNLSGFWTKLLRLLVEPSYQRGFTPYSGAIATKEKLPWLGRARLNCSNADWQEMG